MSGFEERVTGYQTDRLFENFAEGPAHGRVLESAKHFLKIANIKGGYLHERDESFKDDRRRLNSEPGIVISNHPQYVDVALILQTLTREDVMIMVNPGPMAAIKKHNIKGNFVLASKDPKEYLMIFKKNLNHIKSGGLFVIFPTGGDERDTGSIDFKPGIVQILKFLKPTDMVYSFYVDPEEVNEAESISGERPLGVMSEIVVGESFNINNLKQQDKIHVDERYSRAEEWQGAMILNESPRSRAPKNVLQTPASISSPAHPSVAKVSNFVEPMSVWLAGKLGGKTTREPRAKPQGADQVSDKNTKLFSQAENLTNHYLQKFNLLKGGEINE